MKAEFSGTCDWCRKRSDDLVEHKDFEEGMAGRFYDVCSDCIKKENEMLAQELAEEDDDNEEHYGFEAEFYMGSDGYCSMQGTEHCDWYCPEGANSQLLVDSSVMHTENKYKDWQLYDEMPSGRRLEMGTRALTVFNDYKGKEIAVLYCQDYGHPDGMGRVLAEICKGLKMVNGIPLGAPGKVSNGGGCLAATTVAALKTKAGLYYLYPAGTRDVGEDFTYTVNIVEGEAPEIEIESYGDKLFTGTAEQLLELLDADETDG